ncbi:MULTISPECIES: FAD-dependent thymidylate synthase [Acidiplasma]|jgi:thymidylate synthase ThyX|uniref:Thymidylate synthase n=1 Tax=Acidiplasma aeolicum TaxID=507754 RepID=A0A0N8VLA3_9ARCH|nr:MULTISPECIES: FAD-dependent thymidylate synthase [Acidiplasma]KQB35964.1 hypothetical protein AOG54_08265 [Acidiplasma aeolicum]
MQDFSNNDRDVFLIKTEKMIDRGALMSRYSRTVNLDIRSVYEKEFKNNPEKAIDFYKKIFLDYGDESISELITAQMGIQNVSNILSKIIEESRIGLSYLEKSSRYVKYNKKVNGHYLFLDADGAGIKKYENEYNELCNELFDFYSKSYDDMIKIYSEMYPIEKFNFEIGGKVYNYSEIKNIDDDSVTKAYKSSLRSSVLDEIRLVLPASTLTNIGVSGNGRAFIALIERLGEYKTKESLKYADLIYNELKNEMPEIIDDATSKHGIEQIEYNMSRDLIGYREQQNFGSINTVSLLDYEDEENAINKALKLMVYRYYGDYNSIDLTKEEKERLLNNLISIRKNRRHKIGRPFEAINYLFQVNTNYGAFRELQRHRFMSIVRKPLSVYYGYDIPETINKTEDLKNDYVTLMEKARNLYLDIKEKNGPDLAQYIVPYAYRYPVAFNINLNELTYFIELRSNAQVHPDLRTVALKMYNEVKRVHPQLSRLIKFVDESDYKLGRLPAEFKKETKKKEIQ